MASTTSTRASGRNQHQPPAAHPIMRPASRKAIKEVNIKGSLICIIHPSTRPPKEQQTHGHIPGAGGPNGYIRYLGTKLSKHGPPGKSWKTSSYLYWSMDRCGALIFIVRNMPKGKAQIIANENIFMLKLNKNKDEKDLEVWLAAEKDRFAGGESSLQLCNPPP